MAAKDKKTEQHIIDTAMHVFFTEGRLHATTQDIADAAGVNRTLIHYYFKSRDQLFDAVFEKARLESIREAQSVLGAALPFRKKIEQFVDVLLKRLETYPYLEISMTTSMHNGQPFRDEVPEIFMQQFLQEVAQEMNKGTIQRATPVHFIMNLFSLVIYPFIVKPLNQHLFGLNEQEYEKIVKERKTVIMNTLFN
ncbi:TetR/AcrR family transcriptional regulator [Chitinophaga silvisoli]|uniref:TetR family transcriptional regulator n=1 Tax=Chitinophaga silvisoli TaxID=2291814 RepID=A0A3E1P7Q4_9BACT|nr:TetR family transcriptional regulator [Chitinophaga silvisoli]RFM36239.1 TetR family transcriptional regulator [Chitinophaga silvisoli]